MIRSLSLGKPLGPVFRMFAKDDRSDLSGQLAAHGLGRSVVRAVRRAKIKVRRWGYVVAFATITGTAKGKDGKPVKLGQLLTLLVRGTADRVRRSWRRKPLTKPASTGRVPPHPAAARTRVADLERAIQRNTAATISAWDLEARSA